MPQVQILPGAPLFSHVLFFEAVQKVHPTRPQAARISGRTDQYVEKEKQRERSWWTFSTFFIHGGPLAQLVEQLTLNQRAAGSIPARPTNYINDLQETQLWPFSWCSHSVGTRKGLLSNFKESRPSTLRFKFPFSPHRYINLFPTPFISTLDLSTLIRSFQATHECRWLCLLVFEFDSTVPYLLQEI